MSKKRIVLFVCEHGAAKSIVAATYFSKLASEMNLDLQASARGTNPDPELSSNTVTGLREDGLIPLESIPQKLSLADVQSAQRVIAFFELPVEYEQKTSIEYWYDVPAVSDGYEQARDAIISRIRQLLSDL